MLRLFLFNLSNINWDSSTRRTEELKPHLLEWLFYSLFLKWNLFTVPVHSISNFQLKKTYNLIGINDDFLQRFICPAGTSLISFENMIVMTVSFFSTRCFIHRVYDFEEVSYLFVHQVEFLSLTFRIWLNVFQKYS